MELEQAKLKLAWLYPEYLNLYGDQGNIICLQKRAEWRHITLQVDKISLQDEFKAAAYDLVFMGGGQDQEQEALHQDLLENKATDLRKYIRSGGVMLTICGGYQLLGKYYKSADGKLTPGIDVLPLVTLAQSRRLIGNLAFVADLPLPEAARRMYGFENHSGLTYFLDERGEMLRGEKETEEIARLAFGRVIKGNGNNGEDGYEGCHYLNCFGTYAHGSFLPKNPAFADYLLTTALQKKYKLAADFTLPPLQENILTALRAQLQQLQA